MSIIRTNLKNNMKIMYEDSPYVIVEFQHIKPGKGNAFSRGRIKNLITGQIKDLTIKDKDGDFEPADIVQGDYQFLYRAGNEFFFMNQETFDQMSMSAEALGDTAQWLLPDAECKLMFWNGKPIQVEPPKMITVTITETSPSNKGDTAKSSRKPAKIETGGTVQVPSFLETGDIIIVNTETGEYSERA